MRSLGFPTSTSANRQRKFKAGYQEDLSRVLRRVFNESHLIPEIRLLKRCMTANLSRVLRQAFGPTRDATQIRRLTSFE